MRTIKSNPEIFLNQKNQISEFKDSLDKGNFWEISENSFPYVFETLDFLDFYSSNMENQLQYLFVEFEALLVNNYIEINIEVEIDELFFDFYESFIHEFFIKDTPELEHNLDFNGALNYCKIKKDASLESIPFRLWIIEKKEILEFLYKFIKPKLSKDIDLDNFLCLLINTNQQNMQ